MSSLQPSLSEDLEFKGKLVFRIIKPETSRIAEIDAKKNSNFNKMFHKDVPLFWIQRTENWLIIR